MVQPKGVRQILIDYIKSNFHYNDNGWYEKDCVILEIYDDYIKIWFDWKKDGWGGSIMLFPELEKWNTLDYIKAFFSIKGLLNTRFDLINDIGYESFVLEWFETDDAEL